MGLTAGNALATTANIVGIVQILGNIFLSLPVQLLIFQGGALVGFARLGTMGSWQELQAL